jgi:hypothetical protein
MSSPSIVPFAAEPDTYLVLDDYGQKLGRAGAETDEDDTESEAVIRHLMEGQFRSPVRVVAFNPAQGWSQDVTAEIADELAERFAQRDEPVPVALEGFIDRHSTRPAIQLVLPIQ